MDLFGQNFGSVYMNDTSMYWSMVRYYGMFTCLNN